MYKMNKFPWHTSLEEIRGNALYINLPQKILGITTRLFLGFPLSQANVCPPNTT